MGVPEGTPATLPASQARAPPPGIPGLHMSPSLVAVLACSRRLWSLIQRRRGSEVTTDLVCPETTGLSLKDHLLIKRRC